MTLEWFWLGGLCAILLPALGHLYHFILAVNVSSGWGYGEGALARIRLFLLAALGGSACFLLAKHLADPWWYWDWPLRTYAALCAVSGGVIWPITSLGLGLRRRPSGVTGHAELLDLGAECGADALIGKGRGAWQLRLPGNESLQLRCCEWEVELRGLPEALDGLSIVQLSDLHFAPLYHRAYFDRVVQACCEWTADVLVITGDLIDSDLVLGWIEPVLGPLEARLGKFAILGNHDVEHQPDRVLDAVAAAGFDSLEGRWSVIEDNGARLAVGGTSAPWGPALPAGSMPPADFRILLSHSPDQFYRARSWGIDLMLSGHNHGGQIRLPAIGPVFMPSVYSRRFDRGFFRSRSTLLYVSEGIGGKHPIRYGCPPEISRFVLRSRV